MNILSIVLELNPAGNPDLQRGAPPAPKPSDTWCNKFAALVTARAGVPIPFGEFGTLANEQIRWLGAEGQDHGWRLLASEAEAQQAAQMGAVVLACKAKLDGHGHLAVVLPTDGALKIAQAGARNFNEGTLAEGFGKLQPEFFANYGTVSGASSEFPGDENLGTKSAVGILLTILGGLITWLVLAHSKT